MAEASRRKVYHVSFVVASGGKSLYVQSDVTNHPALFARNPGWHGFQRPPAYRPSPSTE